MQFVEKLNSALAVTPVCSRCKGVIPGDDINVAKDIAFCRNCGLAQSLSAMASGRIVDANVDLTQPPSGTWFRREGDNMVTGATNRSLGMAFRLLFFTLFWNGIVSVFVLIALTSTLHLLGVSLPGWFPAFFAKSNNYPPWGLTIFLWLFLTPFIAIGLSMFFGLLNSLAGRTEIRLQGGNGVIFTGVGPLGFRRRFAVADVKDVRIEDRNWVDGNGNCQHRAQIVIDTNNKPLKFGSPVTEQRRQFLAGALKQELVRK